MDKVQKPSDPKSYTPSPKPFTIFWWVTCMFDGRSVCRYTFVIYRDEWIGTDRLYDLVVRVPGYRSRGPRLDSRRYQIFWEVVGLERGPLSLVRIIEELHERKSSGFGLENRINGRRDPLRWPRDTLCPQKLAITSPTSGGRSVGIVRLRTKSHGV
jgi:hypothetical protein